jgi:enoyl-CoA hydratase/carnithine racemase
VIAMITGIDIDTGTDNLHARVDGPIGWMTYDNPSRLNAVSQEMQNGVVRAVRAFTADPEVRVVIVHGAGDKAFVSGADISEFGEKRAAVEARAVYDGTVASVAAAWDAFDRPVIAMIRGYCLGFGLLAAMQADIRIAADDAQFGIPAARLGLGYASTGVEALLRLVGPAFTSEILFSAGRFSADDALRMGLVNRVVPVDALESTVLELARGIADNAPLTVRAAKAAIRDAQREAPARDRALVDALVEACFRSEDYREGRAAFLEKRSPRFEGR